MKKGTEKNGNKKETTFCFFLFTKKIIIADYANNITSYLKSQTNNCMQSLPKRIIMP